MDKDLLEMFKKSTFSVSEGKYIYTKVGEEPPISNHFLIAKDEDETTIITKEENLAHLKVMERNENLWRLVSLNLSQSFMAGTLAAINSACAKDGLNNLVVSTYSKDYLIVKDQQLEAVRHILHKLGFKEKPSKGGEEE